MKKRIDVMIDENILKEFRKICLDRGMTMSFRIEKLMRNDLKKGK
jgi:hypothetical protein